ncbi:SubName: Full=Uncharacterized protein {ECO:0000313/EMBL:CCA73641.1} [Serendipita indica DSM 11827]|nr:SubName: Full=Uncharacterized protein {ECO:0000313/EMBL:CCA73641.1} [Serendipita indica DSM 11827]
MSRSQSRGRENYVASGRGGAGNIRPASRDPAPRGKGPDDFSLLAGVNSLALVTHSGRGGAGNVRSPSRDPEEERKYAAEVAQYVKDHTDPNAPVSTGRGGYANIDRSRSRSKEPSRSKDVHRTPVHTYGHGGAGNIAPGAHEGHLAAVEEDEIKRHHHAGGIHSTGRGGGGNMTSAYASNKVDAAEAGAHHQSSGVVSSGRGGYGNMTQ